MRTVNASILKEERPEQAAPLNPGRYDISEEYPSYFHKFNNVDRIVVVNNGIGEKSEFVQAASHFI